MVTYNQSKFEFVCENNSFFVELRDEDVNYDKYFHPCVYSAQHSVLSASLSGDVSV